MIWYCGFAPFSTPACASGHEGHARQCATGDSTWPLPAGLRIGAFLFQTFKPASLGFAGLRHQTARMCNRNRNRNRNFNRNRFTDIA